MAVFMAVGSGFAGLIATRQMSEMAHEAALHQGRAVLDALSIPAAVAIATHDYTKLDNFVAELERAQHGDLIELSVLDHDGRLMATSKSGVVGSRTLDFDERFVDKALEASDVWFSFGPDPYRPLHLDIAKPILQGQRWGTLIARFSLDSLNGAMLRLERWTVAITAIAAVLGWAISFYLVSIIVITPARRLQDLAQKLEHANRELALLAITDGLTGLKNHRFFQTTLEFEIKRGSRRIHPLSLLMIDIDHFKTFNDSHGHPAGDEVLKRVGALLMSNLRGTDLVARYGGEEFAVILLDTTPDEGFRTAQKLCQIFRQEPFDGEALQPNKKLTISIGVASFPDDAEAPDLLVRCADLALYDAKRRGRNQVVRYSPDIPQHTGMTSDAVAAMPVGEAAER
jgi:diguanylate cyclase (GGDEF)-like protein